MHDKKYITPFKEHDEIIGLETFDKNERFVSFKMPNRDEISFNYIQCHEKYMDAVVFSDDDMVKLHILNCPVSDSYSIYMMLSEYSRTRDDRGYRYKSGRDLDYLEFMEWMQSPNSMKSSFFPIHAEDFVDFSEAVDSIMKEKPTFSGRKIRWELDCGYSIQASRLNSYRYSDKCVISLLDKCGNEVNTIFNCSMSIWKDCLLNLKNSLEQDIKNSDMVKAFNSDGSMFRYADCKSYFDYDEHK